MHRIQRKKGWLVIAAAVWMIAPVLAQDHVAWVKDYKTALKQAAQEKKFIVLDISASW